MTNTSTNADIPNFDPVDPTFPTLSEKDCFTLGIPRASEAARLSRDISPYLRDIAENIRANIGWGKDGFIWFPPCLAKSSSIPKEAYEAIRNTLQCQGYRVEYYFQYLPTALRSLESPPIIGLAIYWA